MNQPTRRLPCLLLLLCCHVSVAQSAEDPSRYDIVWHSPSADSSGSMPLGNGEVGANVWVEPDGALLLYIARTDAWSGNGRLLKLGRVRITSNPPLPTGDGFRQHLKLSTGEIEVSGASSPGASRFRIWIDANRPVIHIERDSAAACELTVRLEVWRTARRQLSQAGQKFNDGEAFSLMGIAEGPEPVFEEPDTLTSDLPTAIAWHHRNETSIYPTTMRLQGIPLDTLNRQSPDPLLHRTFGGMIEGAELASVDSTTLRSTAAARQHHITIHTHTQIAESHADWERSLARMVEQTRRGDLNSMRAAHAKWWRDFWSRSFIHTSAPPREGPKTGEAEASGLSPAHAYALQRYINACAGRGAFPIKFNGSLFTVDATDNGRRFDADYRRWGPCYWFQNTRLPYWSMLAAGDFEMMKPLFRMYADALPMAQLRSRVYYKHDGAFFPETIFFWGAYQNEIFGWNREGEPIHQCDNSYIRWYWSGVLELSVMMLDYHDATQDDAFAADFLVPLAGSFVTFYDQHFSRDSRGKLLFKPAASLETWHEATNPLPEIAGLRIVCERLIALPESMLSTSLRETCRRVLRDLPALPARSGDGPKWLLPAEEFSAEANVENPELYAIWPYRIFGIDKPDLPIALETFARRKHKLTGGWQHSAVQAAYLGLASEAAAMVRENVSRKHGGSRFPAFWGPNYDWVPDQCHGNVTNITLQRMLMQCEGRRILLLPAWPAEWDVHFKLHAPVRTTVECVYRAGKIESMTVLPPERATDVRVMLQRD